MDLILKCFWTQLITNWVFELVKYSWKILEFNFYNHKILSFEFLETWNVSTKLQGQCIFFLFTCQHFKCIIILTDKMTIDQWSCKSKIHTYSFTIFNNFHINPNFSAVCYSTQLTYIQRQTHFLFKFLKTARK